MDELWTNGTLGHSRERGRKGKRGKWAKRKGMTVGPRDGQFWRGGQSSLLLFTKVYSQMSRPYTMYHRWMAMVPWQGKNSGITVSKETPAWEKGQGEEVESISGQVMGDLTTWVTEDGDVPLSKVEKRLRPVLTDQMMPIRVMVSMVIFKLGWISRKIWKMKPMVAQYWESLPRCLRRSVKGTSFTFSIDILRIWLGLCLRLVLDGWSGVDELLFVLSHWANRLSRWEMNKVEDGLSKFIKLPPLFDAREDARQALALVTRSLVVRWGRRWRPQTVESLHWRVPKASLTSKR